MQLSSYLAPKSPLQYITLGVGAITAGAFAIVKYKNLHLTSNLSSLEETINNYAMSIFCAAFCFYFCLAFVNRKFDPKPGTLASYAQPSQPRTKRA